MVCYTEYQIEKAQKYLDDHWVVGFDGSVAATEDDAIQWLDAGSPEGDRVDTYEIPVINLEDATKKLDALRRKCAKLDCPDIGWRYGPRHLRYAHVCRDAYDNEFISYSRSPDAPNLVYTGQVVEYIQVQVRGTAPSLSGWSFVATLSPIQQEDGTWVNLIYQVPSNKLDLDQFHQPEHVGVCAHCGKQRRRSKTYLVANENGEILSVGATCVKDFLGYNSDPSAIVSRLSFLNDLGTFFHSLREFNPMEGKDNWSLEHFLAQTVKQIALDGSWTSKTAAQEHGRSSTVSNLFSRFYDERKYPETRKPVTEEELAEARAIVGWFKTVTPDSDYMRNLAAIVGAGLVGPKTAGLAASLVQTYRRETQKTQERKSESTKPSEWVGVEGERTIFKVKVDAVRSYAGSYGETGIHRMQDTDGNLLVWFASSSAEWLDVGAEVQIKATVKKHDEYKGTKQTILSRVTKL